MLNSTVSEAHPLRETFFRQIEEHEVAIAGPQPGPHQRVGNPVGRAIELPVGDLRPGEPQCGPVRVLARAPSEDLCHGLHVGPRESRRPRNGTVQPANQPV